MKKLTTLLLMSIGMSCAAPSNAQHVLAKESEFTMALTGDSIMTRRLSVYKEPEFLRLIKIIRESDAAFTNLEMLFHDYEPYPMAVSGGTWMRADPALLKDLTWAGFDLVSRANNHTGDYGVQGQKLTTKYVKEAGLVQAGVGMNLAEAREAKFLETPKARVALISIASTFADHMAAGRSRDNVPARPGLNPLRFKTEYILTGDDFDSVRKAAEILGQFNHSHGSPNSPDRFTIFHNTVVKGEVAGIRTTPNEKDMHEIVQVVKNASRLADITLVTIHAHEGKGQRETPADFLPLFARQIIDAGADVFVGHGPHILRGIEIYKNKPIFYSLGDFIFQNETLLRLPSENYEHYDLDEDHHVADFNAARYKNDTSGFPADPEIWESIVALPTWKNGELTEVKLVPISLGYGLPASVRGRPVLATRELSEKILADLQERSAPFNTEIEVRNGIGYVKLK